MEEKEIKKESTQEMHPLVHTYQDDLSRAMDTTDATVVAKLMADARQRESDEKTKVRQGKQRGWYVLGSIILIVLALGASAYGIYYFKHLTVKVAPAPSVGIFPLTDPILTASTDIRALTKELTERTDLGLSRPTLTNLVTDQSSLTPVSNIDFFNFLETSATEPFVNVIALAKLGVMNTGDKVVPFVIVSTKDPEIAAKEFLIAEPSMLNMFYKSLNIDISNYTEEVGKGFESGYMYNLPIRTLSTPSTETSKAEVVLFYGSVTDNIIVITTDSSVLKAIYDSVIRQQ